MNNKGKICYANKGKGKPDQDVRWYTSKSNAAIEAAQLGFTNATGAEVNYVGPNMGSIPGIMTLEFVPSIGERFTSASDAKWAQNAFNLTFRRQYTQMRRKNTASPVYNAPDLGIYTYSIDSLYSFHAWCCRLYKIANLAKNKNRYYFDAIITALGVDAEDLRANLADFRIWINNFKDRINGSLSVPNLPLFERHYWLNSHIWKDGNTDKSQLYLPSLVSYFKYNATYSEQGGGCNLVRFLYTIDPSDSDTFASIAAIETFGENMLNALLNDDDILLIAADVDKWYGGNQFILPDLNEKDTYEPEYSLEVLTQIQNTSIINGYAGGDLQQNADNNCVIQVMTLTAFSNGSAEQKMKPFVTMPFDTPKPEEIVVATRNTVAITAHSTTTITAFSGGSEICIGSDILYYDGEGRLNSFNFDRGYWFDFNDEDAAAYTQYFNLFDMHPAAYSVADLASTSATVYTEIENSTPIAADRLSQIHRMACLNEFGFYDVDQGNRE